MSRFDVAKHEFTPVIIEILAKYFGDDAEEILDTSPLLGYLNNKTRSANKGSKSRGAFANHYALYVLVEDYVKKGFPSKKTEREYKDYEGAKFTDLFKRQRELPFGAKLQNHALNSRLNDEFRKFYPTVQKQPIVRNVETGRYWIQEDLLLVKIRDKKGSVVEFNIALAILEIIDAYVNIKLVAFGNFIETCRKIVELNEKDKDTAVAFIKSQLQPHIDARIFEIVSYAVLKEHYSSETIWIGDTKEKVEEKVKELFKTGRTNANDGGIDFVMRPPGRFFQVTETIDVDKYFLDIDKVQRFPITFVVKSTDTPENIISLLRSRAISKYKITSVVESYMHSIEEIININLILEWFDDIMRRDQAANVMNEIVVQSKLEFNYNDEVDESYDYKND